jgi:hypothetical protein
VDVRRPRRLRSRYALDASIGRVIEPRLAIAVELGYQQTSGQTSNCPGAGNFDYRAPSLAVVAELRPAAWLVFGLGIGGVAERDDFYDVGGGIDTPTTSAGTVWRAGVLAIARVSVALPVAGRWRPELVGEGRWARYTSGSEPTGESGATYLVSLGLRYW